MSLPPAADGSTVGADAVCAQGLTAESPAHQPKTMGGAAVSEEADADSSDAICSTLTDIMCLIGVRYTQDFRVTLFRVTLIQAGALTSVGPMASRGKLLP